MGKFSRNFKKILRRRGMDVSLAKKGGKRQFCYIPSLSGQCHQLKNAIYPGLRKITQPYSQISETKGQQNCRPSRRKARDEAAIVPSRHRRQSQQVSSHIVCCLIDYLIEGQGEAASGIGGGFLGRGEAPKPLPEPPSFPLSRRSEKGGPPGGQELISFINPCLRKKP